MRILYVIDGLPYPLTTGRLRQYHFLRELSARHEIVLLALTDGRTTPEDLVALRAIATEVEVFPPGTARGLDPATAARRALAAVGGPPVDAVATLREQVRTRLADGDFDAVILNGKRAYHVAADASTVPTVADMCDAASARAWSRIAYTRLRDRPRAIAQWAEVSILERRVMGAADHLVLATPRDRDALVGGPRRHVSVIPNGIDTTYWARATEVRPSDSIVFTGAMDYAPNEDAALHLIRDILPLIRTRRPSVRLSIVGRDPTPELIRVGKREGVLVTGFVDDVRPYLEAATVFAAPIRFGTGIQNKVLEALAMELPVVASSNAADGLRIEDGEVPPVVVGEGPPSFAERLLETLAAAASDPRPLAANRGYVERNFVWSRCARRLERSIEETVAGRQAVAMEGRS